MGTGGGHRVIFVVSGEQQARYIFLVKGMLNQSSAFEDNSKGLCAGSLHRFRSQDHPLPGPSTTIPREEIFAAFGVFFTVHLRFDYIIGSFPPFLGSDSVSFLSCHHTSAAIGRSIICVGKFTFQAILSD